MDLLEHLEKRWKELRRKINVPEFANGAGEYYVYFTPINGKEQQRMQLTGEGDVVDQVWQVLLHKACDEDGDPIFSPDDKDKVLNYLEFTTLARVANELADFVTLEQAEKN